MSFYPTVDQIDDADDKNCLLQIRTSLRSLFPLCFWAGVSIAIIFAVMIYVQEPRLRWLAIVPVGMLLEVLRRFHDDLYVFGLHKVMHYNGRLSLSYNVPSIKYAHIRSVTVNQTMWGRIFDFGDVLIQTAAQDGNELAVEGVRAPEDLAALVEELRNNSRKLQDSGDALAEMDHAQGDADE